jgi:thioredoxin 1
LKGDFSMIQVKLRFAFFILMMATNILTPAIAQDTSQISTKVNLVGQKKKTLKYKITFIELGSLRCIPCREMQVVMKAVEEKYGSQVKVVFHDVWTQEGKPYAEKYDIDQIPTQVFLDENGVELYRHTGYFPEEELVTFLKSKGVK